MISGTREGPPERGAPRLIPFGGGKGGVGKTFVAANLATTLAKAGHRVVAVDGDLEGANLHTALGVARPRNSVAEYAAEREEDVAARARSARWRAEGRGDGGAPWGGAAARREPVLALPRRRARRLPARARDLPAPAGDRRPRDRGRLAAGRGQARGDGDPARPPGIGRPRRRRPRRERPRRAARGRGRGRGRRARRSARSRRCARSSPTRRARCCSRPRASPTRRSAALRVVVHEGESLDHRRPQAVHERVRRDRVGRGVRGATARC